MAIYAIRVRTSDGWQDLALVGPPGPQGPPGTSGTGSGNVVGPAGAVADRIAVYNGTTGTIIKDGGVTIAGLFASPAFTGNPTAPTPTAGDNDTSIATTAFVTTADNAVKTALIGSASSGFDTMGEIESYIASNITPVLGNKADIFSPTFTGNPSAPTPTAGDNDTSIATTAFVTTAVAAAPTMLASSWLAGANPNNSTIFIASRALTITSLVGVLDVANGAAATVTVVKSASGTALSAGTVIHSGSFNANGTANTNQTLTLTTTTMASGDRLGIRTTGTFTNAVASITVTVK
jgi:hypothetical protein